MKSLAVGLFVLASGCAVEESKTENPGSDDSADDPAQRGPTLSSAPRIDVLLTDAPGDFESVWVNIARVEIESAADGWITLTEAPQRFDLLTLQHGVTAALGGATLAPGAYGQLRMIVDSASVVVGGVESSLRIASGAETGIKIPLDRTLDENVAYELTLDYDADKSVKSTGQGYLMTPVIQVKDLVATPISEPASEEPSEPEEPIL